MMGMTRKKITVVGAGFTGATTAFLLAQKELGNVYLLDIPALEKPTQGKALDMLEASPVQRFDSVITGVSSYEETKKFRCRDHYRWHGTQARDESRRSRAYECWHRPCGV